MKAGNADINVVFKGASEVSGSYSKLSGGAFYTDPGTGNVNIQVIGSTISNSKTDYKGGFLYSKGTNVTIDL